MITDFLDGIIARVKKEKTSLGKVLDPLADKLLLMNAFIWIYALRQSLPLEYKLPFWVVLIVVSRDLLILLGIAIFSFLKVEVAIAPNIWGKLTTLLQMSTILCLLLDLDISPFVWSLACLLTFISGITYLARGIKALNVIDNNDRCHR
jgi:cardiolipin synthase